MGEQDQTGLERLALDLHVHTPASKDWRGPQTTPEQLVERAIALGLDGIAVTDHATGAWVDKVKAAANGTSLAVFPGVEINDIAGNAGIHILALFEMATTTADIDRFLTTVGALHGVGGTVQRGSATSGPLELLQGVDRFGGIAVLAHCRSSKGALGDMRGDLRTELVRNPTVLAAESTSVDYFDPASAAAHKRVFDLLDGTDLTYQRELAVYQASDSLAKSGGHDLAGMGGRFTYFWAERPLCLESLRQCFVDRQTRIEFPAIGSKPERPSDTAAPAIQRLQVVGGFLDGIDLRFHDGLTTVLGAKGSGKSIMVELLRFAMGQEPTQPDVAKDHAAKLEKVLRPYGRVAVTIRADDGHFYSIHREYDPARGNPYHDAPVPPEELMPCHFFSQNEIVRLAESEDEQIRFIDSFFDFRLHQRGLDRVRAQVIELDHDVARQIQARKAVAAMRKTQQVLKQEIVVKEAGIKSPVFAKYSQAQAKTQSIDRAVDAIAGLSAVLSRARLGVEAVPMPPDPGEPLRADPDVRRVRDLAVCARTDALAAVVAAIDAAEAGRATAEGEQRTWKTAYDSIADQYSREVQKAGGDQPALSQARARLVGNLNELEVNIANAEQVSQLLTPTYQRRKSLVSEMRRLQSAYTQARQERCEWFADKSGGQINASVSPGTNRDQFRQRLTALKKGSYLTGPEIETLVGAATPDELVSAILRYDSTGQASHLQALSTASGLPIGRLLALANTLLGEGSDSDYMALLQLQYAYAPSDRPAISFRQDDATYTSLSDLSTGQKCTAFLVMALCEGNSPIIVDQPEDSLDIRSIWEDMCKRLRVSKRSRQFLFATHNSSLAVASDSDKFLILVANKGHAQLVMSGSIDNPQVRKEVIQLLEGGQATYFLKQRKYNVHDPWARSRPAAS